jgi:hypothetical protein
LLFKLGFCKEFLFLQPIGDPLEYTFVVAVLVSGQLEFNLLKMSPDRNHQQKLRKELFMTRLRHDQGRGDALSEVRRQQDEGCAFISL